MVVPLRFKLRKRFDPSNTRYFDAAEINQGCL